MKSLKNSVQLMGRLGKDPEVKTFDNGKSLTTFTIATNEKYINEKGEKVEDVQWHSIVAFGKVGEIAGKYLKKGSEVAVEGKLVHKVYETAQGEKRYFTQVNLNELVMVGGKDA